VGKHRLVILVLGVSVLAVASLSFLLSASCLTRPQTLGEQKALEQMRSMTRNDVLPSEEVVVRIENQFKGTKTAALARLLRARIKLSAKDFAGAADLLQSKTFNEQTSLGDYALYLRATALEDGNPDVFLAAVGNVAKARGMSEIAETTGLGRESLYKAFAPGAKPRYDTVLKVLQSLGVKLSVTA